MQKMDETKSSNEKRIGRPPKDRKKEQYTITLDPILHKQAQEKADLIGISFSALVSIALDKYLRG